MGNRQANTDYVELDFWPTVEVLKNIFNTDSK